jgi:hypothetical protein
MAGQTDAAQATTARTYIRALVPPCNVLPTAPSFAQLVDLPADAIERFRMPVMRLI